MRIMMMLSILLAAAARGEFLRADLSIFGMD
jgi:hypothetical protein